MGRHVASFMARWARSLPRCVWGRGGGRSPHGRCLIYSFSSAPSHQVLSLGPPIVGWLETFASKLESSGGLDRCCTAPTFVEIRGGGGAHVQGLPHPGVLSCLYVIAFTEEKRGRGTLFPTHTRKMASTLTFRVVWGGTLFITWLLEEMICWMSPTVTPGSRPSASRGVNSELQVYARFHVPLNRGMSYNVSGGLSGGSHLQILFWDSSRSMPSTLSLYYQTVRQACSSSGKAI